MKLRSARGTMVPTGLVAVALAVTSTAVALVAGPAAATPSTKYYTSTATPSSIDVSTTPMVPPVTFTLTNCGSGCTKGSTQSWGSAHVTLPHGWDWGTVSDPTVYTADGSVSTTKTPHWATPSTTVTDSANNVVVELGNDGTSSTYAIAPGEYLTFTASLTPSPAGLAAIATEVKQSNDFSGTGNDFLHASGNTDPTIVIGPPDHLEFGVPPQTVQVTTSSTDTHFMCDEANNGPTVRVVDKGGSTVSWVSTTVTLASTGNPVLKYKATSTSTATTTLTESTVQGVATFGSACTTGLTASALGGGYVMSATAPFGTSTLSVPAADQESFDVLQYVQPCGTSCGTPTLGKGHTTVGVQANGLTTHRLTASVGVLSQISTCSGDDGNALRSIVSVDLADHSKNVLLSWDKQAVQVFVNNGTPFWQVCMWGTFAFPTRDRSNATPVPGTTFYVGVLPDCGASNVGANDPCIASLYRRAGVEYASVTLPLDMPGDPQFK